MLSIVSRSLVHISDCLFVTAVLLNPNSRSLGDAFIKQCIIACLIVNLASRFTIL